MNIDEEIKKLELQNEHHLEIIKQTKQTVNEVNARIRKLIRIKKDATEIIGALPQIEIKEEDKVFKDPAQLEIDEEAFLNEKPKPTPGQESALPSESDLKKFGAGRIKSDLDIDGNLTESY